MWRRVSQFFGQRIATCMLVIPVVIWPTSPPGNNLTKKVGRIILELSNRHLRSFSTFSKIKKDIQYLRDML
jgi:hypothetical protein